MDPVPNIPNFMQFDPTRYRGGEPVANADWMYLRDNLGVKRVVQLDSRCKGSAATARQLGLDVRYHPINVFQQMAVGPNDTDFRLAVADIFESPSPVFVHCLNGRDRTGLAVGFYRVWFGKQTKDTAYAEMIDKGSRIVWMPGLRIYWATHN